MIILSSREIKLTEQLLITFLENEPYVTYQHLGERVNPPIIQRQVSKYLEKISILCYELGLPFLSAKVVTEKGKRPGEGFFDLYIQHFPKTSKNPKLQIFEEECKRISECTEWYKLADYLHIDLYFPAPDNPEAPIRILPMNMELEFQGKSIEDMQRDYFLGDLIYERKGIYCYRGKGLNAPAGSLVLFQCDNMLIASAKFLGSTKCNSARPEDYQGAFKFDVKSIAVFQPITVEEINRIDKKITHFSQVKYEIDPVFRPQIDEIIKRKQTALIAEEIPMQECHSLKEGAKRQIIVNSYERNPKARQACLQHYGTVCVVCGFDYKEFYGDEFAGKIHVHHLKALSEIEGEYEVDPIEDMRPVCPNCHLALHAKAGNKPYGIDELKAKIRSLDK